MRGTGSALTPVAWTPAPLDAAEWGDPLQLESGGFLAGFSVAEPRAPYGKRRIYVDTSVIGGCEDEIFREGSQRLFEDFRSGRATLVISKRTFDELEGAPEAVRAWLRTVPAENMEEFRVTKKAEDLADAYLAAGAVGPAHHTDALHVALASLAGVDFLASWNLKHMVAPSRINAYNEVNRRMGYPAIDIREPPVPTDDQ